MFRKLIGLIGLRFGFGKRSPEFCPGCAVYIRGDGTWIFPQNNLGGIGVMVGPAQRLEAGSDPAELGAVALAALARSRYVEDRLPESWNFNQVAKEAGFKSHGDLERGAAFLHVHRAADGIVVGAWADSHDGGYSPVVGSERTCKGNASELGSAIIEASALCVPRGVGRGRSGSAGKKKPIRQPDGEAADDPPISFGYKMGWVAVRTEDSRAVAESIGLGRVRRCRWEAGLKDAGDLKGVFVTPAVEGWTLAVGSLPEAGQDEFHALIQELSGRFGKAYYFGTHRVVEYQAWAFAENGELRRAFAFGGERGEFTLNVGERTAEEMELNTGVEEIENAPDEEIVLSLARRWVLDPRELDLHEEAVGPGWFGKR